MNKDLTVGNPEKILWRFCLPFFIVYFAFPKVLVGFFLEVPSAEALRSATLFLRILSPFYFVVSAKLVSDGILRGSSRMKEFMVGTFTDLIIRVVLAILLAKTVFGYVGIWMAWPVGWSIATAISIYFYKRSKFE